MTVAKRRAREKQERRVTIVDAAEKVFSDKGFEQATMDDIAAAAELSKGTLYLYFKSKDDLFAALSSRVVESAVHDFENLATSAATGLAALQAMMQRHAELILANPAHFRTMVGRLASGHLFDDSTPEFCRYHGLIDRVVMAFITAIERGKKDGTMRPGLDPAQVSGQLWGGFLGTMLIRINSDVMSRRSSRPVNFCKFVDGFIDLVCNGLAPTSSES